MAESPVEPAATSSPPPISTWDALAVELGIEVKPETARAPAPMRMSAPKQAEKKTAVRSEHQQEPFRQATAEFGERIEPFGISEPSSAEEPQEQREKKSHRRRRRHRKDRDTGHPGAKMEESSFGSQRDAPLEEDVFVSEASLETVDKSGTEIKEESNEEPGKGHSKHHRSRRGSRNRRKKGSESDREVGIDAKQAATAGHDAPAASSETPQGFEGEEEIADEDLEDRDEHGAKSPFRAIPTWEEAVGCIVTKNMESRPRRQGSGPPRSEIRRRFAQKAKEITKAVFRPCTFPSLEGKGRESNPRLDTSELWPTPGRLPQRRIGYWNWSDAWNGKKALPKWLPACWQDMRRLSTESGGRSALAAAALVERAPASLVVVCPHVDDVDDLADDLALFTHVVPERFPAWERLPNEEAIADETFGDRVRLLKRFQSAEAPKLVLCSIQSLLQPVPDRGALSRQTRRLGLGRQSRIEDMARWLAENGFHNTPAVELPGEFSIRGGILDIFAPTGSTRCGSSSSGTRSNRFADSRFPASEAWKGWIRLK